MYFILKVIIQQIRTETLIQNSEFTSFRFNAKKLTDVDNRLREATVFSSI